MWFWNLVFFFPCYDMFQPRYVKVLTSFCIASQKPGFYFLCHISAQKTGFIFNFSIANEALETPYIIRPYLAKKKVCHVIPDSQRNDQVVWRKIPAKL